MKMLSDLNRSAASSLNTILRDNSFKESSFARRLFLSAVLIFCAKEMLAKRQQNASIIDLRLALSRFNSGYIIRITKVLV